MWSLESLFNPTSSRDLTMSWRKFIFFEQSVVKDPSTGSDYHSQIQSLDVTSVTSGRGQLVFGDSSGYIHLADRSFDFSTFQAYEVTVTHLKQMKQRNILISIGADEEGINPTIKVWNMDKADKSKSPLCLGNIRITFESRAVPVSCFAVLENLSQMAVGLANGAVLLIRGDISRDRFTKQKILTKEKHPITALGFREQGKNVYLFVVTTDSTACYLTSGKEQYELLDEHQGCELGCGVLSDPEQDIILGKKEAVYFYGSDGRGPCFAFEGEKKLLAWFRSYLIIVSRDAKMLTTSLAPKNMDKMNSITIYDLKNKFIGFNVPFNDVTHVVSEWGSIFVLTGDKQLFQLEERDTATKLEMLFKKNLYVMAINLATSSQYDYGSIIEIFRKYGDHLYSKGDYTGAMTQYLSTIGRLEPSYVIRKFLDAQRIHNLTSYLQKLHEAGLANADHTTLLLNCYTKLKDVQRLDEFIKTDKELNFDVETAIKV
eukprot:Lithocolla_globosa_v1_NODE_1146_length_2839_cov_36.775503.p1 type:complete len:487 gc:universal NODE_1146_length_2839_cov_36.775503:1283-2743(+)